MSETGATLEESVLSDAARLLDLNPTELNRIVGVRQPLPVKRAQSIQQANEIAAGLGQLSLDSIVVPVADLRLDQPAKKIYALEFSEHRLTATVVATNETISVAWDEIVLLVLGRLVLNRVQTDERRRRGRKQTVNSSHVSADDAVLDLYAAASRLNWRIKASSFDFSCLGAVRSVTAFANFTSLIEALRERAPGALFDNAYGQARGALEIVIPLEPQMKRGDWRRSGAGKLDTATIMTTDNERQFTEYSRLRFYLKNCR